MGIFDKVKELKDQATAAFKEAQDNGTIDAVKGIAVAKLAQAKNAAAQLVEQGKQAHESGQLGEFTTALGGAAKEAAGVAKEIAKAKIAEVKGRFGL